MAGKLDVSSCENKISISMIFAVNIELSNPIVKCGHDYRILKCISCKNDVDSELA